MSWRGVISVVLLLGGAAGMLWVVRNPRLERLMEAAEAAEDSQEAEQWLLKAMEELRQPEGLYLNWSTHRQLEPVICARLANLYEQRPDPARAEQWHLRAVSYYQEKEDPDGLPYTTIAIPLSALAAFYEKLGRLAEADRTYSQAVTAYARQGEILGDGGYISATNVVNCLYRYARLLVRLHRPDDAAAMRKQAREIKTRLGKDFPYWPEE